MCRTEILSNICWSVLFVLLLSTASIRCTNYGSDTAPSRQAFAAISGTGNTIMSFAGMYNGFALLNSSASVTFNSRYPVGTTLSLQGGALTLSQDLILDSNLIFGSPGTIIGNNHTVEFAPQHHTIFLPSLLTTNNVATAVAGNNSYAVNWSPDGQYVAIGTQVQSAGNNEFRIFSFNGSTLTPVASSKVGIRVTDVAWQPMVPPASSPYYIVAGYWNGLIAYEFTPPSTLVTTCTVDTGTNVNSVVWHPSGNQVFVSQITTPTPQIQVYNFNAGMLTPNTSYSFSDTSQVVQNRSLALDYSGQYLIAGCSNANQLQVLFWDGISLSVTASANTGQIITGLTWSPDGSLIAAGGLSNYIQMYKFDRNLNTLTLLPSYNVILPQIIDGLSWSPDGRTIACVTERYSTYQFELFMVNTVAQNLLLAAEYTFNTVAYTVKWSPNSSFVLAGIGGGNDPVLNFLSGPMYLQNTDLVFNSPAQLRAPIVCSGPCTINGNGYTLDLNSQTITATAGSSLSFNNVVLEGITGTNLQCVDGTGIISFRNATCVVNNRMQWSQGSLAIIGDFTMTGTGTFIYSSSQTSTIYHGATWYFNRGMTFNYYPQSSLNNLLNFADVTAQLYLYETALHAQSTGLQFTKGTLAIEGRCPFYSDASVKANGILFGDNGSSANNINLMIMPESGIDCRSGYVVEQNIGG